MLTVPQMMNSHSLEMEANITHTTYIRTTQQSVTSDINAGKVLKKYYKLFQWCDHKQIILQNKTCLAQVKARLSNFALIRAVINAIQNYLTISGQPGLVIDQQLESLL